MRMLIVTLVKKKKKKKMDRKNLCLVTTTKDYVFVNWGEVMGVCLCLCIIRVWSIKALCLKLRKNH